MTEFKVVVQCGNEEIREFYTNHRVIAENMVRNLRQFGTAVLYQLTTLWDGTEEYVEIAKKGKMT